METKCFSALDCLEEPNIDMSAPPVCSYNMTTLTPLVYKLLPEVLQFFAQSPPTQPLAGVNIIFKLKGPETRKETTKIEKKKNTEPARTNMAINLTSNRPLNGTPTGAHDQTFSSVAQSCPTLCDLMDCSTPGLPVHHQLPGFTQTHVH